MSDQLQAIKEQIEALPGSYRFLYTEPKSINSPYIFVGLNPGGQTTDPVDLYVSHGNAFINEKWNKSGTGPNALQDQVTAFFKDLSPHLGQPDWATFMSTQWLISNYVFYRSPRWPEMAAKKAHINNSKAIWTQIFATNQPKVIVANGQNTYENMLALLVAAGWTKASEQRTERAWDGPHIATLTKDTQRCLLIGFAHLSTFKIIKRAENKAVMQNVYTLIKTFY
jgi:hypothetical protein